MAAGKHRIIERTGENFVDFTLARKGVPPKKRKPANSQRSTSWQVEFKNAPALDGRCGQGEAGEQDQGVRVHGLVAFRAGRGRDGFMRPKTTKVGFMAAVGFQ